MLRTNTKKYNANFIEQVILPILETEQMNYSDKNITFETLGDHIKDRFLSEQWHKYNRVFYKNNWLKCFSTWLAGLSLDITFENYYILELDKNLREYTEDLSDKKQADILNNYFDFMAYKIISILKIKI